MNGPVNSAVNGSFSHTLTAISEQGLAVGSLEPGLQLTEFADLLAGQEKIPELLEQLKGMLPEQDFEQIETLLLDGNGLPQPASTVTPEGQAATPVLLLPPLLPFVDPRLQDAVGRAAEVGSPATVPIGTDATGALIIGERSTIGPVSAQPAGEAAVMQAVIAKVESGVPQSLQQPLAQDPGGLAQVNTLAASAAAQSAPEAGMPLSRAVQAGPPDLNTTVAAKGWDKALGERVLWMVGRSIQGASLRLTPPNLGPIEIQLSLQQDQATVNFSAQHAAVRDALEASIPRLREMFLENNLQLVNVDVAGRENHGQRSLAQGYQESPNGSASGSQDQQTEEQRVEISSAHQTGSGLLDDYA